MLLEMLTNEVDAAAGNLARDNQTLCQLLRRAVVALRPVDSALASQDLMSLRSDAYRATCGK